MYESSNNNLTAEHRSVSFMSTHLRSANIILTLTCSNNLQAHATMLNPSKYLFFTPQVLPKDNLESPYNVLRTPPYVMYKYTMFTTSL